MKKVLEIKNLTKYYGQVLAVENLNLSLRSGEVFGFIGPNGAGKSTTIRCIMNLINKTEGQVLIDGKEFTKDDIKIKKRIGYLPSEINLYEDYTVKEMLDFSEKYYDSVVHNKRVELVKRFKLDESKMVEDLSLGNLKKLAVVLAFMIDPEILIIDEAISGLDPIMQNEFYNLLKEEKSKGKTIFYSTHVLSEIPKICDRVGIIKDGKLIKIVEINKLDKENKSIINITSKDIDKIIKDLNIKVLERKDNMIKFEYKLSCNELIKKLSKYDIQKLLISEQTIEDMFLDYYN